MASELQSPVSVTEPTPAPSTSSRAQSKSRSRSRPARRRRDSSPTPSSPPGLPTPAFSPDGQSDGEETVEEDTLSPFDPRRITPTLHASLVSEILSLRREVENKTKAIDTLEQSLDETRTECETLGSDLSQSTRESRSLKHQLKLLEGGTSSAMTELVRERDDAVENIGDVRKKLEAAQKRVRHREEEVERTQSLWDRDRESWENERRGMERKIHVVEGRLKTVLNEVAAAQEAGTLASQHSGEDEDLVKDKNKESDTASVASSSRSRRRQSMSSVTTEEGDDEPQYASAVRYSVMPSKGDSSLNLAQELAFDEDEEDFPSDEDTPASPEALPEERPMSVLSSASRAVSSKAQRILGMTMSNAGSPTTAEHPVGQVKQGPEQIPVEYCDSAVQYSPPPSPLLSAKHADVPLFIDESHDDRQSGDARNVPEMKDSATFALAVEVVSSSCQTADDLPSPPWTPKVPELSLAQPAPEPVQMSSASTQTDPTSDSAETTKSSSLSPNDIPIGIDIPMIAIHPPGSEPTSPRNSVVLPPQTKNVSIQTNFRNSVEGRSIAIQTEEIRIDKRPVKLPASLLPSAIPDLPTSAETQEASEPPYRAPVPPPRSAKRPPSRVPAPERTVKPPQAPGVDPMQAYPGNNDNGPLSDDIASNLRRPFRSSSLFAGFEQLSDDETPKGEDRDIFTDEEFLNRPFASYTLRRGKMVNAKSRPSQDEMTLSEIDEQLSDAESRPSDVGRGASRATHRSNTTSSSGRQPGIRKMALISSGAAAHQKSRPRSPSEPSIGSSSVGSSIAPPFPVPMRYSSRKVPLDGSDGPPSPTRSTGRQFSDRSVRSSMIRPSLRRVQSENTISEVDGAERPETCSTPTRSPTYFTPDSPSYQIPPLPFDDITVPRENRQAQGHHRRPHVPSMDWGHEREDSTGGVQPTSVVDAIAQTMVGEWMFKYVRRRKSFGMGDGKDSWEGKNPHEVSANITNSGVRHKRWVWLAPYEGSIMWSSKQPTSGPALLGKTGRKFTIQSVLDVKDDNPLPKGSTYPNPFNRSILVLTPQRALKFTALTAERHYVWLTALSFLSHSSMALSDLAAIPPAPQEETVHQAPAQAALRRNPIRDSIRVAKGRPRPMPKGKRSFPDSVPEIPNNDDIDDAADAPTIPRFSNQNQHTRKRSNTAPRPPALHTLRSFSSQGTMPSSNNSTNASSDIYISPMIPPQVPPNIPAGINSVRSSISRTSEANAGPSVNSNVFDMGTMRMEAFIDNSADPPTRPPPAPPSNRTRHVRKTSSAWSQNRYSGYAPSVDSEFSYRPDDPFRGF